MPWAQVFWSSIFFSFFFFSFSGLHLQNMEIPGARDQIRAAVAGLHDSMAMPGP